MDDYLAWCAAEGDRPCLPVAGLDARHEAASTPETKRDALDNLKSRLVSREARGEITAKAMMRGIETLNAIFDTPEEPR